VLAVDLTCGGGGSTAGTSSMGVCATADEGRTGSLACPVGQVVKSVVFASFGTPGGSCHGFTAGACDAATSKTTVEAACLGNAGCAIAADDPTFGDPCVGTAKRLAVEVACGAP
jgi:hypothetical protein